MPGRDGGKSECILLFSRSDILTNKFLIEHSSENDHTAEYKKLNEIVDYCNTAKCLRKYILEYFGEKPKFDSCDFCSNCDSSIEKTDITLDAQKILSCVKRMNERFGSGLVTDVLKGSNTSKIRSMKFDSLSTYGIMSEYSKQTIKDLISFLVAENYLELVGNEYPTLALSEKAKNVLFNNERVIINKKVEKITKEEKIKEARNDSKKSQSYDESLVNKELFEILRKIRREIANENNVPPFIIFADVSLKQMAIYLPKTEEEMLNINGVGELKMQKYGKRFLDAIINFEN